VQRRSKATIAGAIGLALAMVAQSPASATPAGWSVSTATTITQQLTATAAVKPLVGDFNGDGLDDVFFYAPGAAADYLWTGKPYTGSGLSSRFTVTSLPVSGTYTPAVGDFDGNGDDDIFWYAAGSPADSIWYMDNGVISSSVPYNVSGTYTLIVGDHFHTDPDNSTMKDDIFFYSATGTSSMWSGRSNRTFGSHSFPTQPPKNAKVLVGNFVSDPDHTDGTYDTDLLFYAAGSSPDALWVGNGDGNYAITPKTINGTYKPFVGNFDLAESYPEAPLTDILWYAPGQAADSVWMNNGTSFSSTPLTINAANYQPYVVPRVLGADAIMWNNTSGQDYQWQPKGSDTFEITSTPVTNMGNRTPIVGRFDDKTPRVHASYPWGTDVLWAEPGNLTAQKEVFWAGDDSTKWVIPVQS
jgi:hypothetical protein